MQNNAEFPTDTRRRRLHDLRISVTDRCNFRCTYCMPRDVFGRDYQFMSSAQLLSYEELARLATLFTKLGVEKIRLTGGEPLVRRNLERLIGMLAQIEAVRDLTLTTNGTLLAKQAERLYTAGLRRVSVSLDSLDDATFMAMNDVAAPVSRVLEGIDAARQAGLWPIKINMVVRKGLNEKDIVPMARHFHGTGLILRFIEYMDVGTTNHWKMDEVVPSASVVERIAEVLPLEPLEAQYPGEVASRYRYLDGGGEIGVISSVTQPFCGACTRARLTADGQLFTCLFAEKGYDVRALLRGGASDEDILSAITTVWRRRTDNYSEIRATGGAGHHKIEMSRIGG